MRSDVDDSFFDNDDGHEHLTGVCSSCSKECTSITIDNGIGSYEAWGSRGTHHNYCEVSPCCEADVVKGGSSVVATRDSVARRDHKDGLVKAGQKYRQITTSHWREGCRWLSSTKQIV